MQVISLTSKIMMIFRIQINEGRKWDREALGHMKQELLAKRVYVWVRGGEYVITPRTFFFGGWRELEDVRSMWSPRYWRKGSIKTAEFMFASINMFSARLRHSFTDAGRQRQLTLKWLPDFDWLLTSYDYCNSHFSLVYFSGLKYIFFSPPNAPFWPVKCATMPARQSDNNAELHKAHGVLDWRNRLSLVNRFCNFRWNHHFSAHTNLVPFALETSNRGWRAKWIFVGSSCHDCLSYIRLIYSTCQWF